VVRLRPAPQAVERLVVGLGNPGAQYARTRHNVGCRIVEELARRHKYPRPARAFSGRYAAGEMAGLRVGLLTPTTFMNDSGKSVAVALRGLKLAPAAMLLVHDHIDLPFGRLRVQNDGGHGGHNGLRSIQELIGPGFDRVRVGVDRPPTTDPDIVADGVLSPFSEPKVEVDSFISRAADAVELWLREGLEAAMQAINGANGPSRGGAGS
jgi:PTH1 family peptidyl-tRNA hydrolase